MNMEQMKIKGKRGQAGLSTSLVSKTLLVVVLLILTFTALADTSADVGNAAGNISAASDVYPLTSFFKKKGVILLAFMAGIALTFIQAFVGKGGR